MSTTPKILLTIAVTTFALSFAPVFTDLVWGILKPVSAVAFIAFGITHMLAKEMALYDEEQRRGGGSVKQTSDATPAPARDRVVTSLQTSTVK